MNEKILGYIYHGLEHSNQAVFFYYKTERTSIYANQQALSIFGNEAGFIDVYDIFESKEASPFLRSSIATDLQKKSAVTVYDVVLITKTGTTLIADVQVAYADEQKEVLVIELFFKKDNRMEVATSQVNQSTRAEGILNFDERLTLVHGNNHFFEVFEMDEEIRQKHYKNEFVNGLQASIREDLLKTIHTKLKQQATFFTKIQIITSKGVEKWYSLELQRRTLDDSGTDKLMVSLVNIGFQVEMEEQLDDINQYFNIFQSMSRGILYRLNIHKRILYRSEETAKANHKPVTTENFPNQQWLDSIIHPDDWDIAMNYALGLIDGKEGTSTIRTMSPSGEYEYHYYLFRAIHNADGTTKEMIGISRNVHEQKETEAELTGVNQQFNALQDLSDDTLFRIDITNRKIIRRKDKFLIFGIDKEVADFPDEVLKSGSIHPEDVGIYEGFSSLALQGKSGTVEVRMKEKNRQVFGYRRLTWIPVTREDGKVTEMVGKLVDIQSVKDLEEQAKYDGLTKALNKRAMLEATGHILARARKDEKHALFFMDLDDFKYVNDNLGHAFGDYLLAELGKRLHEGVRYHDLVGRVGGDEFVLFLRDVPCFDVVLGKAKMILSTISEDFFDGTTRHTMHGSLGIAVFPDHGTTYEELYHHADLALYRSKHKGKNQVTMYSEDLKNGNR